MNLRPLYAPQAPIPAGTYGLAETAARVWAEHLRHRVGCWAPLARVVAAGPAAWPWLPWTFARVTAQHAEDWRRAVQSIADANEAR